MVCIVTTTFYKSVEELRFKLALKTVEAAREHKLEMVIVDGSPIQEVPGCFTARGAQVSAQEAPGMGSSRRQAIRIALALGARVIIWMEPEKYPLIPFLPTLTEKVEKEELGMVVPRRLTLTSYPQYQQLCEFRGNWEASNFTGRPDLDLWFGPRIFNEAVAQKFLEYQGEYGDKWDSIFIPVIRALACGHKQGYGVGSTIVDYTHPQEQTEAEEGDAEMDRKRDIQLSSLLKAIEEECKILGLPRFS